MVDYGGGSARGYVAVSVADEEVVAMAMVLEVVTIDLVSMVLMMIMKLIMVRFISNATNCLFNQRLIIEPQDKCTKILNSSSPKNVFL